MATLRQIYGFALCLLMLGMKLSDASSEDKRPNVLFVVVDDLRPTLGCYGESIVKTPNVDNLARKSVMFEQAFVQQAICGPSRVSFLTSRRPDTTRLYDFYSYWRVHAGNYTTLPQHFKEHGYITQSVGKVFHPGKASNFSDDSPYSWTNTPYHPPTQQYKMAKVCPNPDGTLSMNIVCPVDVQKMPGKSLPDIQSADFAVNFLKNMSEAQSEQPFFLAVGFHKPHIPLKYPKEFLDLYPLSEIQLAKHHTYPLRMPLVAWNPWTDLRERDDVQKLNISFPFGPVPEHFQLLMRQSYYAATSYMDSQLGKVLSALEDNGFSGNTIISFVGDHGWALGEHQEWSKYSVFDVAARVPLMIHIPGVTHQKRHGEQIFPFLDPFKTRELNTDTSQHGMEGNDEILTFESETSMTYLKEKNSPRENVKQREMWKQSSHSFLSEKNNTTRFLAEEINIPLRSSVLVELVDLFPTLAEAANLPPLPLCPEDPFHTWLCTEGACLMSVIRNVTRSKQGAHSFSTYDQSHDSMKLNSQKSDIYSKDNFEMLTEGSDFTTAQTSVDYVAKKCSPQFTASRSSDFQWKSAVFSQYPRPSVEPREDSDKPHLKNIRIMGYSMWTPDFHYTEWVGFEPGNYTIKWDQVYGRELYLRSLDPYEINNVALFEQCFSLVSTLSKQLHSGWRAALPKQS